MYDLALLCDTRDICWNGPAHLSLDHDSVPFGDNRLNYFDSKIRDRLRKGVPNDVDSAADRHDTLAAIRGVSTESPICTKSGHTFDIVSVIGRKKLLCGRREISRIRFHICSCVTPSIRTTDSVLALFRWCRAGTNARWLRREAKGGPIKRAGGHQNQPCHRS